MAPDARSTSTCMSVSTWLSSMSGSRDHSCTVLDSDTEKTARESPPFRLSCRSCPRMLFWVLHTADNRRTTHRIRTSTSPFVISFIFGSSWIYDTTAPINNGPPNESSVFTNAIKPRTRNGPFWAFQNNRPRAYASDPTITSIWLDLNPVTDSKQLLDALDTRPDGRLTRSSNCN